MRDASASPPALSAAEPLFAGGGLAARELGPEDIPAWQAFYDANPEYFLTVNGRAPPPGLAAEEYEELPPPHLTFTRQWRMGLVEGVAGAPLPPPGHATMAGVVMLTSDLCLPAVWHLGLFIVATRLRGSGAAQGAYDAMEGWVRRQGARHLRLAVVLGNGPAERFWARQGYRELRRREGIDTGGRINTVRVMLKPLADESLEAYLEAAPRDRPGSPLP